MKKRKNPDTSHAAYLQADELIPLHHRKIISSLRFLKRAIAEEISNHRGMNMDKNQVSRRMLELEGMLDPPETRKAYVFKPGDKKKTSSGRDAYVYVLTELGKTVDLGPDFPEHPVVKKIRDKKLSAPKPQLNLF